MTKHSLLDLICLMLFCNILDVRSLHPQTKENNCITVGGNDAGVSCKFPFVYDMWDDFPYVPATVMRWFSSEKRFESCTDYRKKSGRSWCATKTTSNNRYIPGHWGECPDSFACKTDEGSWQSWTPWSEWGECVGVTATCGNVGLSHRSRKRNMFSRKANYDIDGNNHGGEETQEDEKACKTRECSGWTDKTCRGGDDIFLKNEAYLISLSGDTKEKCQALCDALPDCSLAQFHSASYRKFYKCIPKANFTNQCSSNSYIPSTKYYVKEDKDQQKFEEEILNNSTELKWNALEDGNSNDCRLCVRSRGQKFLKACQNDCSNIPKDLKDMEIFMSLAQNRYGGSSWWSSDARARKRFLKMFKGDKLLLELIRDMYNR